MLKNSPNMAGGLHTLRKDPRLMPLGGFLRKTKRIKLKIRVQPKLKHFALRQFIPE